MLTGAALATINRIPVLLLPSGTLATRVSAPVLQELELPHAADVSVNDAFRPLSRFFDQVDRPEQLPSALLGAMRVLADPVETGAATISLPQDVQAEAFDWPVELFADRVWHVARPPAEASRIAAAADAVRSARRPLVVAGGGVHYSGAEDALARLRDGDRHPRRRDAGRQGLAAARAPPARRSRRLDRHHGRERARRARPTSSSASARAGPTSPPRREPPSSDSGVRFVSLNVAGFDAGKHSGLSVVADAREALTALTDALDGWAVEPAVRRPRQAALWADWDAQVDGGLRPAARGHRPPRRRGCSPRAAVHRARSTSSPTLVTSSSARPGRCPATCTSCGGCATARRYHVEYGYSCMGYEIPGALGVALADDTRDVFAMVGDGGYLMMPTELVTAVQERVKVIVVLVQNHGFHSIGSLSEGLGSQRFGTSYQFRGE